MMPGQQRCAEASSGISFDLEKLFLQGKKKKFCAIVILQVVGGTLLDVFKRNTHFKIFNLC